MSRLILGFLLSWFKIHDSWFICDASIPGYCSNSDLHWFTVVILRSFLRYQRIINQSINPSFILYFLLYLLLYYSFLPEEYPLHSFLYLPQPSQPTQPSRYGCPENDRLLIKSIPGIALKKESKGTPRLHALPNRLYSRQNNLAYAPTFRHIKHARILRRQYQNGAALWPPSQRWFRLRLNGPSRRRLPAPLSAEWLQRLWFLAFSTCPTRFNVQSALAALLFHSPAFTSFDHYAAMA